MLGAISDKIRTYVSWGYICPSVFVKKYGEREPSPQKKGRLTDTEAVNIKGYRNLPPPGSCLCLWNA